MVKEQKEQDTPNLISLDVLSEKAEVTSKKHRMIRWKAAPWE